MFTVRWQPMAEHCPKHFTDWALIL